LNNEFKTNVRILQLICFLSTARTEIEGQAADVYPANPCFKNIPCMSSRKWKVYVRARVCRKKISTPQKFPKMHPSIDSWQSIWPILHDKSILSWNYLVLVQKYKLVLLRKP